MTPSLPTLLPLALLAALAGCSSQQPMPPMGTPDLGPSNALVAARPYDYKVPDSYDPAKPMPLLVVLHGYSALGVVQDAYFGTSHYGLSRGFLTAYPDGLVDSTGNHYWNATDACCDFDHKGVDDVAYLDAVISDMGAHYNVDPKRVFLIGHSNGGFMAHRLACDRAGRIAGFVALAGDNWKDVSKCRPTEPVAALQIHGDMDLSVPYQGDPQSDTPSALESITSWATLDGCAMMTDTSAPPFQLDLSVQGAQTQSTRWSGCRGGAVELWTMHGSGHLPNLVPDFPRLIYDFLSAHPKP